MTAFFKSFNEQLLKFILQECKDAQLLPETASQTGRTLADLPLSVVYFMVSEVEFIRNPRIRDLIRSYAPVKPISGWPNDDPPAGLLVLLMDKSPEVRAWASSQVAACTQCPMSADHFLTMHSDALQFCTRFIMSRNSSEGAELFSDDLLVLWGGYSVFLRFVPRSWLLPSGDTQLDIRRTVIGHLSDIGPRKFAAA